MIQSKQRVLIMNRKKICRHIKEIENEKNKILQCKVQGQLNVWVKIGICMVKKKDSFPVGRNTIIARIIGLHRVVTCQGKTKFSPGQGKVREF